MSFPSGGLVHDRYRIEAPLGSTETTTVYRAFDTQQNQPCELQAYAPALPLPAGETAPAGDAALPLTAQERALTQFMREARLLARLDNPHIPRVIEHFVYNGEGYLASAWVEGRDLAHPLAKQLSRGVPAPEEQVLDWADQLLATLAYCHAHGVVHRDVQPANILATPTNWLYLINFGLMEHTVALSPYTPPERQRGPVGARGDIYGLGATLYALLTGQEPPTALQRQSGAPIPSPRQLTEGAVSAGLVAWLDHAMALDPATRFQSAGEMRLVLNGVRREESELAALFAAAWAAYRHGRWTKAERLLTEVVRQQPDYRRYGQNAADLLAQARERSGQRPRLLLWLGVGLPALAVAGAAALAAARGLTPPPASPTATPSAVATTGAVATLSPTASPVQSPTLTMTSEPSPTPLTPTRTVTASPTATRKATARPSATLAPPTETPLPPSPTAVPPTAEPPSAPPPAPPPTAQPQAPTTAPSATVTPPPAETPVETATEAAPAATETPAETATAEPPAATSSPSPAPGAGSSPSPTTTL